MGAYLKRGVFFFKLSGFLYNGFEGLDNMMDCNGMTIFCSIDGFEIWGSLSR